MFEAAKSQHQWNLTHGGEGGIRTPGTGFSQYNGLANRRLQPLGHLSGVAMATFYHRKLRRGPPFRRCGPIQSSSSAPRWSSLPPSFLRAPPAQPPQSTSPSPLPSSTAAMAESLL